MPDDTEARWHEALENQADVVGRPQVLRAGISRNVVRRRLGAGRWQRLHRGVYATFSGPRPREAQLWAALLRAGPGATLSHYTAAELHGLIDSPADQIHVTVPATRNPARQRKITGLVIHRSCRIEAAAIRSYRRLGPGWRTRFSTWWKRRMTSMRHSPGLVVRSDGDAPPHRC